MDSYFTNNNCQKKIIPHFESDLDAEKMISEKFQLDGRNEKKTRTREFHCGELSLFS